MRPKKSPKAWDKKIVAVFFQTALVFFQMEAVFGEKDIEHRECRVAEFFRKKHIIYDGQTRSEVCTVKMGKHPLISCERIASLQEVGYLCRKTINP